MLPADAEIHRQLCTVLGQRDSHSVMFATDAGWLQRIGLECVLFGPGTIKVAHRPNESLPIGEFVRAGHVLDDLIQKSCIES
jgi:acetylornithine deacetylase